MKVFGYAILCLGLGTISVSASYTPESCSFRGEFFNRFKVTKAPMQHSNPYFDQTQKLSPDFKSRSWNGGFFPGEHDEDDDFFGLSGGEDSAQQTASPINILKSSQSNDDDDDAQVIKNLDYYKKCFEASKDSFFMLAMLKSEIAKTGEYETLLKEINTRANALKSIQKSPTFSV